MLPYAELAPLRLRALLPATANVFEHDGWEWMGLRWWYEGCGFTWFGRLEAEPKSTVAFELYFQEMDPQQQRGLLRSLDLNLEPGSTLAAVEAELGASASEHNFVVGQTTYEFLVGKMEPYVIRATVHNTEGLLHVSAIKAALVMRSAE